MSGQPESGQPESERPASERHARSRPALGTIIRRVLVAFGQFWWDFLVGETPELFVGGLIVVGVLVGLVAVGASHWLGAVLAPIAVIVLLTASLARASRQATHSRPGPSRS